MIRVVIKVDGDDMTVEAECEGLIEVEAGMLLLGLQQAKKMVLKNIEGGGE